jgi:quinohemoprotein ethanol dehydrogenase
MSFNPATGLVYVPATISGTRAFAFNPNFTYQENQMNTGQAGGRGAPAAAAAANPLPPLPPPPGIGPLAPEGAAPGALLAWDPVNQKERWRAPIGGGSGGGTLSTAGNLVFQVVPDGRLMAYTADKGDRVLEIQTGLRGGMGPPIAYMLDGKQYVALAGGQGARGDASAKGPAGGRGGAPVNPKLLVFVLDGKAPLPAAPVQ